MAKKQTKKAAKGGISAFFKWLGILLGSLILIGATTGAILCCYATAYIQDVILPEVKSSSAVLVTGSTDLSSIIYYKSSKGYQKPLQTLYASENRLWVTYDEIPQELVKATIAIEDKRFREHHGVDWKRTAAAMVYMFTGQRIQGGSTITQQLIKNLTRQDQVTVRRKVLEIFEALQFDKTHTKDEIMEWYLNEIYLGRGCYGVVTASQKYFGKDLSKLDLAECAALISITNNPSLYDPYNHPENNLKRRTIVLDEMYKQGMISEEVCKAAQAEELTFNIGSVQKDNNSANGEYYSWYTDAVISSVISDLEAVYGYDEKTATQMVYSGGLQIYSCYQSSVQKKVNKIYTDIDNVSGWNSSKGEMLQSAITVVDNNTGAVVALAGGIGEKVGNRIWNRATSTLRQPGSSIKPLAAYSQALEEGIIFPNTIVEDSAFTTEKGRDWPKNSHGGYQGKVTIPYAVEQSINTIPVKLLDQLGTQNSFDFLTQKFGLNTLVQDYVGPSGKEYSDVGFAQLGLGGITRGVSTYQMAAAYSTFPRGGVYIKPHLYTVVLNSDNEVLLAAEGYDATVDAEGNVNITAGRIGEAILNDSTCFYMTQMLESVIESGTGTNAMLDDMSCAGKTGTTDDDYDRWFVGYTPYYTAAVWTGYDRSSRVNASTNPAVVLWRKVMNAISSGKDDIGFEGDRDTVDITFCGKCGGIATSYSTRTRDFLFIRGEEPGYTCTCKPDKPEPKPEKPKPNVSEEKPESKPSEEETVVPDEPTPDPETEPEPTPEPEPAPEPEPEPTPAPTPDPEPEPEPSAEAQNTAEE